MEWRENRGKIDGGNGDSMGWMMILSMAFAVQVKENRIFALSIT